MKEATVRTGVLPVPIRMQEVQWLIVGGGQEAFEALKLLLKYNKHAQVKLVSEEIGDSMKTVAEHHPSIQWQERRYELNDLNSFTMVIVATGNSILNEKVFAEARQQNALVYMPSHPELSSFIVPALEPAVHSKVNGVQKNNDLPWKKLASRLVLAFVLMVMGHILISYLPLPSIRDIWSGAKPYFDYQFLLFVVAGFLAQMVDGMLSMGYGVTSATCLMSFNVSPVSVSAAIHTSEIFTTGISGYSHYKFGNVNKKLFKHLVIPGVIGSVLGALVLVFVGERYSKYLMPLIALYAAFLGLKILVKAFQQQPKNKKVKKVGWLAWAGGFFDSFGGGGWGPIVTSQLISKGRSPRYTVGSVSLTEFFVTLSSAFTFFVTVGVTHWNIVLGLIIGGTIAAPIAARLAGKLPRKTMMILVGVMVMVWCVRMFIKSVF